MFTKVLLRVSLDVRFYLEEPICHVLAWPSKNQCPVHQSGYVLEREAHRQPDDAVQWGREILC